MSVYKKIQNVDFESITNSFFANQFIGYFLKIPQFGYYSDNGLKSLKPYFVDRINESIRGIQTPDVSVPVIAASYFAHQNTHFMGVGDGELGMITIRFLLDRYLNNYCSFLNWSFLKYDWTFGGKNPNVQFSDLDLQGIFSVEFLDSGEKRTRKILYKVLVDAVPGLALGTDTPDQVEFQANFRITDIDISQFVEGEPLIDNKKLS